MSTNYAISEEALNNLGNATRTVTGTENSYTVEEMATLLSNYSGGGSGTGSQNIINFNGTTAAELNTLISAVGQRDMIQLSGHYDFTETVEISGKMGIKIIGAGRTTINSTAQPAFYIHDNTEWVEIEGISVYHTANTSSSSAGDPSGYTYRIENNTFMNFLNMLSVGTKYGYYFKNNIDCKFEYCYFHQNTQQNASSNLEIIGFYNAGGNNSCEWRQCGSSIIGNYGTGYFIEGIDIRDIVYQDCETTGGGIGLYYKGTEATYTNNVHFSKCYFDTSAEKSMVISSNSIDHGAIFIDNCYCYPLSSASRCMEISGRGINITSTEFHDKPILIKSGSERVALTNSQFINCTLEAYGVKALNLTSNNFVYNDGQPKGNCALVSGCYGSLVGNNFLNYNESIYCEYDFNLDSGTEHKIYYSGNYAYGLFYHTLGMDDDVSPKSPDNEYPIGYIYMSTIETSPAELFGGSWETIAGRFLVGKDNGQFITAGITSGGSAHTHSLNNTGYAYFGSSINAVYTKYQSTPAWTSEWNYTVSSSVPNTSTSVSEGIELGGSTNSSSNLPPYLVVYMWKRVA